LQNPCTIHVRWTCHICPWFPHPHILGIPATNIFHSPFKNFLKVNISGFTPSAGSREGTLLESDSSGNIIPSAGTYNLVSKIDSALSTPKNSDSGVFTLTVPGSINLINIEATGGGPAGNKNVKTAWKKFQEVAMTGTVGAGINFSEKHFDVTFAIVGCSSCAVECQFQFIHRGRHKNKNLLYLWIDRPSKGEKGIPTKKQICKELDRKHRDGEKMSPALLSMPSWLKDLYVCELQDVYRTTRALD